VEPQYINSLVPYYIVEPIEHEERMVIGESTKMKKTGKTKKWKEKKNQMLIHPHFLQK
jgi:hypothetical protein